MSGLASIRCAVRKPWVIFASLAVLAFAVWSVWSSVSIVEARNERRAEAQEARSYLCGKVNELPNKLARLLVLSDQRRALTGATTTTVVPPVLSPAERARLEEINAEIARLTRDLGEPIDCALASTGTTTTTTPGRVS